MTRSARKSFWDTSVKQAVGTALKDDKSLSDKDVEDIIISTLDGEGVTRQEYENLQLILKKSKTISQRARMMIDDFCKSHYSPPVTSAATKIVASSALTTNFRLAEFACKDGTCVPSKFMKNVTDLANSLQVLRDTLGIPIKINSAYRTATHNKKVGGVPDSQHCVAKAADIVVRDMTPALVASKIEELIKSQKMLQGGIGVYRSFVHYDVRGRKARW